MAARDYSIVTLLISVIVRGSSASLYDRHGHPLQRSVPLDRLIGPTRVDLNCHLRWYAAVSRIERSFRARQMRQMHDPWIRKVEVLLKSFNLRSYSNRLLRGRTRFQKYATTTWADAAERLLLQGHNRYRRHIRSGWERWAHTVSNNQAKKVVARYGRPTESNSRAAA